MVYLEVLDGSTLKEILKMVDGKTGTLNNNEFIGQFGHVDATLKMVEVGEPQCLLSLDNSN